MCRGHAGEQEVGYWPLYCAALNGRVDVIIKLLDEGAALVDNARVSAVLLIAPLAVGALASMHVCVCVCVCVCGLSADHGW
jgi:hypothetical protein